jgi:Uma2 family endonuclease
MDEPTPSPRQCLGADGIRSQSSHIAQFVNEAEEIWMEYLAGGVKQVWLVSPEHHTVTIYRSSTDITAFAGDGEVVSEDLFPGFRCPLREIFTSPVHATL